MVGKAVTIVVGFVGVIVLVDIASGPMKFRDKDEQKKISHHQKYAFQTDASFEFLPINIEEDCEESKKTDSSSETCE